MVSATKNWMSEAGYIEKIKYDGYAEGKVNILIVDDRQENLVALEAVLTCPEYNLFSAKSGEEALKYILKQDFAVILLDVQMPGIDGFETAMLIKAREKSRHIPIIFITAAYHAVEHVMHGYSVGAIDYIFKPFHPEALQLKVAGFVQMYQNQLLVEQRTKELMFVNNQLEREIQERAKIAERFQKLFQASPCLMSIRSLADGRYIDMNKSWLNYTGYTYTDIKSNKGAGMLAWRFHSCPNEDKSVSELQAGLRNLRISYRAKNGEQREGLLSTEVIEVYNEKCLLSVITDISEQVALEQELAKMDRLHLIGEMAAGLAHEVRNPMTTIRGFLQLAKNQGRFSAENIDIMIGELDRTNVIISEFLKLAKDKRNDRQIHCLNEIIKTLFPLIQSEALLESKSIKLDLGVCPPLLLDEKEIRQLILNFAINGLEAMNSGGVLEIITRLEGQDVTLEIRDHGTGIKDDILKKLGTPFFTTKENGTGMGLAICYSIAARHEADIDVKTSGNGTSFIIRFKTSAEKLAGETQEDGYVES